MTVYDGQKSSTRSAPTLLQPTGLAVLDELGALAEVVSRGSPVERLVSKTARGRTILSLSYGDLGADIAGLAVHRGNLLRAITNRFREQGVTLALGREVTAVKDPSSPVLVFADGHQEGPFDLVVLADGARRPCVAAPHSMHAPFPTPTELFGWSPTTKKNATRASYSKS